MLFCTSIIDSLFAIKIKKNLFVYNSVYLNDMKTRINVENAIIVIADFLISYLWIFHQIWWEALIFTLVISGVSIWSSYSAIKRLEREKGNRGQK